MSARSLAKQALSALNHEKPHSSITDWVEILTAHNVEDEAYDGIPELVDSINLQPTGPAEASRAIRKKLKHGDQHRQYRALVILKALVENGGSRFQTSFADNQLTDAIKLLASDPGLDPKVRRKLNMVLASWYRQFKNDPKMTSLANLYKTVKDSSGVTLYEGSDAVKAQQAAQREKEARQEQERRETKEQERREAKEQLKREKEEAKMKKASLKAQEHKPPRQTRRPFDFEKEKPKVLNTIVEASQASNNLVNALQLVNRERENVQTNARVQECLLQLKQIRKQVVKYVQLVENEQFIGTLIDTNERVIAALETYDNICGAERDVEGLRHSINALNVENSEVGKLQSKQRDRVARSINRSREALGSPSLHPNLEDISFGGNLEASNMLPPPLRPSAPESAEEEEAYRRGSLSDYSDYDSSEEDLQTATTSHRAHKATTSTDNSIDDPFADPFADQDDVGTERKAMMTWG